MLKILVTREAMLESALLQRIANQSALQSVNSAVAVHLACI